jgi:hypothetical protein
MVDLSVKARRQDFVDLDFSFRVSPISGDVALKRDAEAVKQSVLNILQTERGEKPFQPTFGVGLRNYLFEPFDSSIGTLVEEDVTFSLENFEPRIELQKVEAKERIDRNALQITVTGRIRSPEPTPIEISFIVERLR